MPRAGPQTTFLQQTNNKAILIGARFPSLFVWHKFRQHNLKADLRFEHSLSSTRDKHFHFSDNEAVRLRNSFFVLPKHSSSLPHLEGACNLPLHQQFSLSTFQPPCPGWQGLFPTNSASSWEPSRAGCCCWEHRTLEFYWNICGTWHRAQCISISSCTLPAFPSSSLCTGTLCWTSAPGDWLLWDGFPNTSSTSRSKAGRQQLSPSTGTAAPAAPRAAQGFRCWEQRSYGQLAVRKEHKSQGMCTETTKQEGKQAAFPFPAITAGSRAHRSTFGDADSHISASCLPEPHWAPQRHRDTREGQEQEHCWCCTFLK